MGVLGYLELGLMILVSLVSSVRRELVVLYTVPVLMDLLRDGTKDEMMRFYRSKANSISFHTVLFLFPLLSLLGLDSWDVLNLLVLFSLLMKNATALAYTTERNVVLKRMGLSIFAVLELFVVLSHGLSFATLVESSIPLLVLLATLLALKSGIFGAISYLSLSSALAWMVSRGSGIGRLVVLMILVFPLVFLGIQSLRKE